MATLETILTVIFIIVCIVLTVIVLMQEGKSAGLGAISGAAETYWGKNKGRSMEGALEKGTRILVILFLVISIILIPVSSKADEAAANQVDQTTTDSNNVQDTTDDTDDTDDTTDDSDETDAGSDEQESEESTGESETE